MIEQTWLTSTNHAEMYTFVKDRVTERQAEAFVRACMRSEGSPGMSPYQPISDWKQIASNWCKAGPQPIDRSIVADLLREIIGNPFRPIVRREGEFWRSNVAIPQWLWEEKPPHAIEFDPAWLTWNSGTVANLVRAIMEEGCETCKGRGWFRMPLGSRYSCETCHGKGYVPRAEPRWEMMPILGDALEEAGCTEAAILDHLRGTEPCLHCEGAGARFYDEDDRLHCKQRCDDCNGTGKRPVRHVRGCWCVELLKGEIQ
jgi:hypothetical protein